MIDKACARANKLITDAVQRLRVKLFFRLQLDEVHGCLRDERGIPEAVLRDAIRHDRLREGPHGSMWAAHCDDDGAVTGWEERGPAWRGLALGFSRR